MLDLLTTHTCAARGRLPYELTSTPSTAAAARTTTTYDERQVRSRTSACWTCWNIPSAQDGRSRRRRLPSFRRAVTYIDASPHFRSALPRQRREHSGPSSRSKWSGYVSPLLRILSTRKPLTKRSRWARPQQHHGRQRGAAPYRDTRRSRRGRREEKESSADWNGDELQPVTRKELDRASSSHDPNACAPPNHLPATGFSKIEAKRESEGNT